MPMSNEDCIRILKRYINTLEEQEMYFLESADPEPGELREVEKDIEAFHRAIRTMARVQRKKAEKK